jgi:hypothetical protein
VTAGLDTKDLSYWRGHSTLLNPYPDYINGKSWDEEISPFQPQSRLGLAHGQPSHRFQCSYRKATPFRLAPDSAI